MPSNSVFQAYHTAYDNTLYRDLTRRFDALTDAPETDTIQAANWLIDACFERLDCAECDITPSAFGRDSEFKLRLWIVRNDPDRAETIRLLDTYVDRFTMDPDPDRAAAALAEFERNSGGL